MNLQTYLEKHCPALEQEYAFAEKAGMSHQNLRHLSTGRRTPSMKKVLGLIRASNGLIKIETLLPELFLDDEIKKLLRKSAA